MMTEGFTLLVVVSLAGTILFGILLLIDRAFGASYAGQIYHVAKIVLIFYFLSAIGFYYILFRVIHWVETKELDCPDFDYLRIVHGPEYLGDLFKWKEIPVIMTIWLAIFLLLFLGSIISSRRFFRKSLCQSAEVRGSRLEQLAGLKAQMGIKCNIGLYENPHVKSPLLMGFFHPTILLPNAPYEDEQWEMFLRHELCHFQSHDLWYRLLLNLVQKIHWFNPGIYFFALKFYDLSELACDSNAVRTFSPAQKATYARLLNLVSYRSREASILANFCGNNYKRAERRTCNIMKNRKQKPGLSFILAIAAFTMSAPMISYGSITAVIWAENKIIHEYSKKYGVMETTIPVHHSQEVIERADGDMGPAPGQKALAIMRGANFIDNLIVKSNDSVFYKVINLNKGDSVQFIVSGNITDHYIGGLIDSSNKMRYISSDNGGIMYTFTITKTDTYTIFFEGRNGDNGSDITLNGSIVIN